MYGGGSFARNEGKCPCELRVKHGKAAFQKCLPIITSSISSLSVTISLALCALLRARDSRLAACLCAAWHSHSVQASSATVWLTSAYSWREEWPIQTLSVLARQSKAPVLALVLVLVLVLVLALQPGQGVRAVLQATVMRLLPHQSLH